MAKKKKTRKARCTTIVFKRKKRGGKLLPKSQWITVERCEGSDAKAKWRRAAKRRKPCRRGGKGSTAHLFKSC